MRVNVLMLVTLCFCAMADDPPATLWSKNYTISDCLTWSSGLVLLDDGSFVISGPYLAISGDMDSYLMGLNSDGSESWNNSTGETAGHSEMVSELIQTANGGFLQAGFDLFYGDGNALFIWTDSAGDSLLYRTYSEATYVSAIAEKANGNIVASGRLESFGEWFGWLAEMDSAGDLIWSKYYGASGIETSLSDFVILSDNSIVACGYSGDFRYIVKTDSAGDTLWTQTYQESTGSYAAIETIPGGGFILAGRDYEGVPETCTAYLAQIDDLGVISWDGNYSDDADWAAYDVELCQDQGFIVCGTKSSGEDSDWGLVFRTSSQGSLLWESGYGTIDDSFSSCIALPSGEYCISGIARSLEPDAAWVIKLGIETGLQNPECNWNENNIMTVISSNPVENNLSISLEIPAYTHAQISLYDLSGRFISDLVNNMLTQGIHQFTVSTGTLSKGIYILRAVASGVSETETVVILN